MSISPNLNMLIGGIQVAQLPGAAAVSVFNLIYENRELAHTHDAFAKISQLRPLAQAINIRLTPNAPRLAAAGAKTELAFSPFEALSLFHIIGANITLRQAELALVTGRIAVDQTHADADDEEAEPSTAEEIAHELCDQLDSAQIYQIVAKLPLDGITASQTADFDLAMALLEQYGDTKIQMTLLELGIDFIHPDEPSEPSVIESEEFFEEFIAEIQDQLSDDKISKLIMEFLTEEDEDDELDVLLDLIIERHGIEAVHQKIIDLGFEFTSDLLEMEDSDEFPADEDEDEDEGPSDYARTVLRNDLYGLHHNDQVILTKAVEHSAQDTSAMSSMIDFLMEHPNHTIEALKEHGIKLPNFEAVMRLQDEDEDREERLHRLDIQDLEILCDVLGINRVDQDHDDLISLLCCRPQSEFESALEITDIVLPGLDYGSEEPTIDEYRANFEHIAHLTMLQSAVAACIADSTQDLVLSFTH